MIVPFRDRRRRHRDHDLRVRAGLNERRPRHGRRRDHRRRAAPVRALRPASRPSTWAPRRSGPRAPTPGCEWTDVQFAFGGSFEVDNPDAVIGLLGLTGIPFMDVYNGCATAATALQLTADAIRSGKYDIGVAVGMDKHEPGAFTSDPVDYGAPSWYGEMGYFLTTKFFGMKINRYMHDHGISHETLARVAAKAYRNGALNPNAFRRKPISEEEILGSRMLNYPLTQYMFCSPDEGAAAVVLCRADIAAPLHVRPRSTCGRRRCAPAATAPTRSTARGRRWTRTTSPTVYASRAAYEQAGIGPDDVDVVQLQDTDAGAEVIHMAENGFCADGEQEKLIAEGATEIGGPLPVNTDGGLHRQRRADRRLGPAPGVRAGPAAAGPGRRPPGPRHPAGRLRPALRRPGHRRRLDPEHLRRRGGGDLRPGPRRRARRLVLRAGRPAPARRGPRGPRADAHRPGGAGPPARPGHRPRHPHHRRRRGPALRGPVRRDPGRPQLRRHGHHRRRRPRPTGSAIWSTSTRPPRSTASPWPCWPRR